MICQKNKKIQKHPQKNLIFTFQIILYQISATLLKFIKIFKLLIKPQENPSQHYFDDKFKHTKNYIMNTICFIHKLPP